MKLQLNKKSRRLLSLVLFLLPFCLYWNAIDNEYAIDDNIVVDGNTLLNEGIKAIPEIFTSFYAKGKKQSYGYRPVVSSSFALEKQFFSGLPAKQSAKEKAHNNRLTQANISHFINIVLYALIGLLLLHVLKQLFEDDNNPLLPYIIVFIFLLLPIHTENVNNIKSRDSLLMFLGMLGALSGFLKYVKKEKISYFLWALCCVLFSLFAKKSALALLGIAPVILYYKRASLKKILFSVGGIAVMIGVAWLVKKGLLAGQHPVRHIKFFENPLLFEGGFGNRLATGFYSFFFYLKMMIWPPEFSFYYGYKKIPFLDFSYIRVWLGLLVFIPLVIYGVIKWWKHDKLGLSIVLWTGTILGFMNLVNPIVGVVADRFAFLPSLGFSMAAGILLWRGFKRGDNSQKSIKISKGLMVIMGVLFLGYGTKIWARNPDWENYLSLYRADIPHLKKSAKANVMLATQLYYTLNRQPSKEEKMKRVKASAKYFRQALKVYPKYGAAINDLAVLDIKYLKNYDEAIQLLNRIKDSDRDVVKFNLAFAYFHKKEYKKAIPYFLAAIEARPQQQSFYRALHHIFKLHPRYRPLIFEGLEKLTPQLGDAYLHFDLWTASFYYEDDKMKNALRYYKKALQLQPKNTKLKGLVNRLKAQTNP